MKWAKNALSSSFYINSKHLKKPQNPIEFNLLQNICHSRNTR